MLMKLTPDVTLQNTWQVIFRKLTTSSKKIQDLAFKKACHIVQNEFKFFGHFWG